MYGFGTNKQSEQFQNSEVCETVIFPAANLVIEVSEVIFDISMDCSGL